MYRRERKRLLKKNMYKVNARNREKRDGAGATSTGNYK